MKKIPIKVTSHAGYKADEYPVNLELNNQEHTIIEILDRWYQVEPTDTWTAANYFKVATNRQQVFIIKHEVQTGNWFLIKEEIPAIRPSNN